MKKTLIIISAVLFTATAFAQRLTEQEAKERAMNFLSSKQGAARSKVAGAKAAGLKSVSVGIDGVYLFNVDGGGYVVAGADARVAPVLGYGDNGTLSADRIPANMKAWLEGYARQTAFAAEHNLEYAVKSATTDRQPIEPLVTAKWGQRAPFNLLCPSSDRNNPEAAKCPTGCVATAMAQVASYHKWPAKAEGTGSADVYGELLKIDMSNDYFDWDNMLDIYNNEDREVIAGDETQWNAVALLMRDMGYSVEMSYSKEVGSAYSQYVPYAMVNNFGYDKGAHLEYRSWYTTEQWDSLVYDCLEKYGPMPYSGVTELGEGHSFVCDGYRGDGYFHINWGWYGISDGYYLLSALRPQIQGTGGAASGSSFDYMQDIIYGLCKPRDGSQAVVTIYQRSGLVFEDGFMDGNFEVLVSMAESLDFGLWAKDMTTGEETIHFIKTEEIHSAQADFMLSVDCDIPDGKYKVKPVFRRNGEEQWNFFRRNQTVRDYLVLEVVDGEKTYSIDGPFEYQEVTIPEVYVTTDCEFTDYVRIKTNSASHVARLMSRLYDEQTGEVVMESEVDEANFNMEYKSGNMSVDLKVEEADKSHTYKLQVLDGDSLIAERTGITVVDKPMFEEIEPFTIAEVVDGKIYRNQKTVHVSFKYKYLSTCPIRGFGWVAKAGWLSLTKDLTFYVTVEDDVISFSRDLDVMSYFGIGKTQDSVTVTMTALYDGKHSVPLEDGSDVVMTLQVVDEDPTSVEAVKTSKATADERIYDLRGVEMKNEKGIYIKGGKVRIKN